jgi:hypothetical protein
VRHLAASGAEKALSIAEAPIRALVSHLPATIVRPLVSSAIDKINAGVKKLIEGSTGGAFSGPAVGGASELAIWKNLRSVGMSAAQAAGVMGNMQSESAGTFNPFIIQGGGYSTNPAAAGSGGYGLVQWTPGSKLIPYLHGALPSVATEVAALAQLSGQGPSPEGAAGALLRAQTSPGGAALAFLHGYERPYDPNQPWRATQAEAIYGKYKSYDNGGTLPPGISTIINGTGRPEPILSNTQWADISQLARSGGGGGRFEGDLYLDSGEFLGKVRGEATAVIDSREARALVDSRKP